MSLANVHRDIANLYDMVRSLWSRPSGIISVVEVVDLSTLAASSVAPNSAVYVEEIRSYFVVDRSSVLTPDGITIVAAAGGGNWLRTSFAHPSWRYQTVWRVNRLTGSDVASGLSGAPLATWAEMKRRLGGLVPLVSCDFYQEVSSLPGGVDRLPALGGIIAPGVNLRWHGARTVIASDVIATVTVENRPTNVPWQMTGTAIVAWAPYLGKLVKITSGANAEMMFWVSDHTGPTAQLTRPGVCSGNPIFDPVFGVVGAGDPFSIYSLCLQALEPLNYTFETSGTAISIPSVVTYDGFDFQNGTPFDGDNMLDVRKGSVEFYECSFLPNHAAFFTNVRAQASYVPFANCYGDQISAGDNAVFLYGGSWFALYASGHGTAFVSDTYFRGTSDAGGGGQIIVFSAGVFGTAHNGMHVGTGGTIRVFGALFGVAGEHGVNVAPAGDFVYAVLPTITGSLGDFSFNEVATDARAFDPATGAYTAPIAATWANVALPTPGGFGGCAHDVPHNAHIVLRT